MKQFTFYDLMAEDVELYTHLDRNNEIELTIVNDKGDILENITTSPVAWGSLVKFANDVLNHDAVLELKKKNKQLLKTRATQRPAVETDLKKGAILLDSDLVSYEIIEMITDDLFKVTVKRNNFHSYTKFLNRETLLNFWVKN